jgi:metal-dependent hydrolase (beta-lactamase superfamily II)
VYLQPGSVQEMGFAIIEERQPSFLLGGEPTVDALAELNPSLLVPAHCTGWKAVHRIASRFPDAFVPSTVGTTITL